MDKKYNSQTWVGNMYQRFEAVFQEVDEFVHKDPVKYVENHMQTVGESVKKFYSGVVQDILPPLADSVQNVAQSIPSKRVDVVETCTSSVVGIKENTVDGNTTESEKAPLVPTDKCHKPSTSGICHSEQISYEISGYPVGEADANSYSQQEGDNQINRTPDKAIQVHLNSSTSSQKDFVAEQSSCKDVCSPKHHKNSSEAFISSRCIDEKCDDDHSAKLLCESSENHLDNKYFEGEGILCNTTPKFDASVFEDAEDAGWGIENIIDLNSGTDKKIKGSPSPSPSPSPSRSPSPSPAPLPSPTSTPSASASTSEEVNVSADRILFPAPVVEEKSENCESFTAHGCDSRNDSTTLASSSYSLSDEATRTNEAASRAELCRSKHGLYCNLAQFEASASCSEIGAADGSIEDLNMDNIDLSDKKQLAESCVIVEGEKLFTFPYGSRRSKSYKKIIQDAFTSRKRLTKEYKQLAIWYGDIDKEFSRPTEEHQQAPPSKSPGQDLQDSEWELL